MDKVAGDGDALPSEYAWAKSFLQEYSSLLGTFKDALKPTDGEDLTEFVDALKLYVISKSGLKSLKKDMGAASYDSKLSIFVDRCKNTAAQNLNQN